MYYNVMYFEVNLLYLIAKQTQLILAVGTQVYVATMTTIANHINTQRLKN